MAETRKAVSYDRDIRPILSDKCYQCHGPDAETREAELRLDTRDGLLDYVVVPSAPDESELVRRVLSTSEDERMPPQGSNLKLTDAEKELLRRWVAEGAAITGHWAFEPLPASVPLPEVDDESWARDPIDRFVLARLESENLHPTPRADRLRLLRRVTLDLTGLPPTLKECREFELAAQEDLDAALAAAVDRLLARPAFGEHLAVAWLDAARYADSYGYQSDQLNTQWPYRDWVVRALNANLGYDNFLTWQVAGDLLPDATRDQKLATAFNRLHRLTNEGGSIAEEWLVENAADRVQTFGTAILGLTIECARCHDHKYDPITMRDYYSLMSFFNSIDENGMYDHAAKVPSPALLLPSAEEEAQLEATRAKVTEAEAALADAIEKGAARFDKWLANPKLVLDADLAAHFTFDDRLEKIANAAPGGTGEGSAAGLASVPGVSGQAVRFDGDHGALFPAALAIDRWDAFTLDFHMRDSAGRTEPVVVLQRTFGTDVGYNGFDIMLAGGVPEARLYRIWPGNGIGVRATQPIKKGTWHHVAVTYDGSSRARGLRIFIDGREAPIEVLRDEITKSASLPTFGHGQLTLGERVRDRGFTDGEIDELRIYTRALAPVEIQNLQDGQALASAAGQKSDELRDYYFSAIDDEARKLRGELRAARQALVAVEDTIHEIPVMRDMPEERPTYVLPRGAYDAPKTPENRVDRGSFSGIMKAFPKDAPRNRLGLARWLTSADHPLTARVFVNRVWANFFGRGLVATPDNFGLQGAPPTHPELLDWLARDFVDHGWDIKRLCRKIVLSASYRQDSRAARELRERDPENELLARGPSRRLSAEQIRDLALGASGLLDRREGGAPVSPYQAGGDLWRETNNMSPPYQQSVGTDLYRRSLYSVWKRTAPLPNMLAFDATTREVCTVSRGRTNTPLQALVLLNDVQFVEAARALATSVMRSHSATSTQIEEAFMRLTGRRPDHTEETLLADLYTEQKSLFAEKPPAESNALTELGEAPTDATLDARELAAMTVTCQAIMNLDATIYER